jgi:hypothetical protein
VPLARGQQAPDQIARGSKVGKWRQRYLDLGIGGLHDELRPGRPRTDEDDKIAKVIKRGAADQVFRWQHSLEHSGSGDRDLNLQDHGLPLAAGILGAKNNIAGTHKMVNKSI